MAPVTVCDELQCIADCCKWSESVLVNFGSSLILFNTMLEREEKRKGKQKTNFFCNCNFGYGVNMNAPDADAHECPFVTQC